MTENRNNTRDDQGPEPFDEGRVEENSNGDADIIELSDIAIGIGPEDDMIIELTEEVIVESMSGITGATSEALEKGEEILDLSEVKPGAGVPLSEREEALVETAASAQDGLTGSTGRGIADIEDQISEELDNYFGTEEDVAFEETMPEDILAAEPREETLGLFAMSATRVEESVERIVRKEFADKIDKIYAEVLKISDDIRSLKERLTTGDE
jgi:hypothetical protein